MDARSFPRPETFAFGLSSSVQRRANFLSPETSHASFQAENSLSFVYLNESHPRVFPSYRWCHMVHKISYFPSHSIRLSAFSPLPVPSLDAFFIVVGKWAFHVDDDSIKFCDLIRLRKLFWQFFFCRRNCFALLEALLVRFHLSNQTWPKIRNLPESAPIICATRGRTQEWHNERNLLRFLPPRRLILTTSLKINQYFVTTSSSLPSPPASDRITNRATIAARRSVHVSASILSKHNTFQFAMKAL